VTPSAVFPAHCHINGDILQWVRLRSIALRLVLVSKEEASGMPPAMGKQERGCHVTIDSLNILKILEIL
jgi:hypothetical protein